MHSTFVGDHPFEVRSERKARMLLNVRFGQMLLF